MAKAKYQAPKPRTKTEQLKEKAQKAKSFLYKSPTGQKVLGYRKKFAEGSSIETKPKRHFVEGAVGYDPDWKAKRAAMQKKAKAAKIAAAKPVRKGKQAKRQATRSPKKKGYAVGGGVNLTQEEKDEYYNEWWERTGRARSEAAAKRNEESRKRTAAAKRAKAKTVRKGKQAKRQASRSPGGYQSGRTVNPRAVAAAARRRNAPKPKRRIRFEGPDWPRPRGNGDHGWVEGGTVEGGTVETYNAQIQRKYHGGKI